MSSTMVTIFYSNFSGNCKALFQYIKNFNLMDKLSIKFVNIDNSQMKDVVSKKFSVVPSIVVMVDDEISLYSGDNAFEWFNIFASQKAANEPEPVQSSQQPESKPKTILEMAAELSKARETL